MSTVFNYDLTGNGDPTVSAGFPGMTTGGGIDGYSSGTLGAKNNNVLGVSTSTSGATQWNTAWNQGYNNANSSSNPYSGQNVSGYDLGQGFSLGQQAYLNDLKSKHLKSKQSSNPTGGTPTGGNPTSGSTTSAEDQARQAYFNYLDNQYNSLPGLQGDLEGQVNNLYNSQTGSINSGLTQTLNNLSQSQDDVTSNKVSSLRDLDSYLQNQLKAGNYYLGTRGAGDSSASNQYNYALSKIGAQNRTNIQNQANQLYAKINTQMDNAKSIAQQQLNELDTWKGNQLIEVSKYIQGLKGNIDTAKANYLQSWLTTIDNNVATYKNAVASWIVNKANSLGDVMSQLQRAGIGPDATIYTPSTGMTWGTGSTTSNGTDLFGNYTNSQKKDYSTLG